MSRRFRNYRFLGWHVLYLGYYRLPIVRKTVSRMNFNSRSFFFGGSSEQNCNQPGDPKNCGKQSGFHALAEYIGKRLWNFTPLLWKLPASAFEKFELNRRRDSCLSITLRSVVTR